MTAFSDRASDFSKINAQVVGCSVDSKFSHLAWYNQPRDKGGIAGTEIPILSDLKKEVSAAYNVLDEMGFSQRALFILDPDGVIKYQVVHDAPIGRSVDEALRVLEAIQHHQETGQVCPIHWKKGADGINPKQPAGYFGKLKK